MAEHLTFDEMQEALRNAADEHDRRYQRTPKMNPDGLSPWMTQSGNGYHLFANAVIDLWLRKHRSGVNPSSNEQPKGGA